MCAGMQISSPREMLIVPWRAGRVSLLSPAQQDFCLCMLENVS